MQSIILTEMSDWSLLIVFTSSIFPSKSRDPRFFKISKEGEYFRIEVSSVAEKGIGYVIDTDGHRGRDPEHARNMKCNRERERGQQGGRSERQS